MATAGVIVAAIYLLWAYQQVFHGRPTVAEATFKDVTWREGVYLAPLLAVTVLLGVFPGPVLDRITPSVNQLVAHVEQVAHNKVPLNGQPIHLTASQIASRAASRTASRTTEGGNSR